MVNCNSTNDTALIMVHGYPIDLQMLQNLQLCQHHLTPFYEVYRIRLLNIIFFACDDIFLRLQCHTVTN